MTSRERDKDLVRVRDKEKILEARSLEPMASLQTAPSLTDKLIPKEGRGECSFRPNTLTG